MVLRLLAACAASLALSAAASAQTALVVVAEDGDGTCEQQVLDTLEAVGYGTQTARISPTPEGMEVDSALVAAIEAADGEISAVLSLGMAPATYSALGVAAYGNIACDAVFLDAGGEAGFGAGARAGAADCAAGCGDPLPRDHGRLAGCGHAVRVLKASQSRPSAQIADQVASCGR